MNNGSCYVQLAGCGVRETSHAWFSIVHPVSKLPEKRIISGNDHWHCPTLLMAISQYLTSHHLCQSYKQRVMCGARTVSSVCCTFYHRTQQWARNCDLNAWQACEMSCWTGCWVMWFYEACRDLPASQPATGGDAISISPCASLYLLSLTPITPRWWRIALYVNSTAGTCGLAASWSQEKLSVSVSVKAGDTIKTIATI